MSWLRYPQTVFVVALTALAHFAFGIWFRPGAWTHGLLFLVDIGLLLAWGVLSGRSKAFAAAPRRRAAAQLARILPSCAQEFRTPVEETLRLIERVATEFAEDDIRLHVDSTLDNLVALAKMNHALVTRSISFGTDEQRADMQDMLRNHATAAENALCAMRDFTGNLSLIEADPGAVASGLTDLEHLNEGLRTLIQEDRSD